MNPWLYIIGGVSLAALGTGLWLVLGKAAVRAARRERQAWDDWTAGRWS